MTSNQQCLETAILREDKKYVDEWVVIAGGKIVYHGTDEDKLLIETRKVQKSGTTPLVHYIGDKLDTCLL